MCVQACRWCSSTCQRADSTISTVVLPNNPLFDAHSALAVQEAAYAYSGWIFAQHFLNRLGPSYAALKDLLDESDTAQAAVLSDIRARFRQETFTRASILETLQSYPEVVSYSRTRAGHMTDFGDPWRYRSACSTSTLP